MYPKAVPGSAGSKAVPEGRTGVSALTLLTQSLPGRYSRPGFGPARPPLSPQGYRLKRALPPPPSLSLFFLPTPSFLPLPALVRGGPLPAVVASRGVGASHWMGSGV